MVAAGSNLDGVRRSNLAAVLTLVHREGGLSRSELTARLGVNRSTIAVLVGELSEYGLVYEDVPEILGRVGRPSPVVRPARRPVVVAVNPEIDFVSMALVGLSGRVEHRILREVDRAPGPEAVVAMVAAELAGELGAALGDRTPFGIGFAVPGIVRASDGMVRWAPHLEWREAPLTQLMTRATGIPAVAGNDANLGALAERLFGAGRGSDDIVYLNGGASGIGGGVIAGGRPLGGVSGYAGEFGQNRPGVRDPADRLTDDGVLEQEVSRARLLELLGRDHVAETDLGRLVLESDDPALAAEVARQARVLAAAMGNAVNVLNPQKVILGGFLAVLHAADPATVDALVADHAIAAAVEDVEILEAALVQDRLLIGAAELAFAALLGDPAGVAEL